MNLILNRRILEDKYISLLGVKPLFKTQRWLQLLSELVAPINVDLDLNAKYSIMCRKTVLIPENDEESTHSGLRQQFHFSIFVTTILPIAYIIGRFVNYNLFLKHDTWLWQNHQFRSRF